MKETEHKNDQSWVRQYLEDELDGLLCLEIITGDIEKFFISGVNWEVNRIILYFCQFLIIVDAERTVETFQVLTETN